MLKQLMLRAWLCTAVSSALLPSKRWRMWLAWGLGCLGLVGLGFALEAWLPPAPRAVLRGNAGQSKRPAGLSPDGKILMTAMFEYDPKDPFAVASLASL